MLNPNDPTLFRTNNPAQKAGLPEKKQPTARRQPEKTKRDFEKVMKRKDKDDKRPPPLARKKGAGERDAKQQGQDLLKGALEEQAPNALHGIAARDGLNVIEENLAFAQETPDIAGLHIGQTPGEMVVGGAETVERSDALRRIEEIVDLIANKLYTLKNEGKTDTIVTLRHPPQFAGAELKLSAYENAPGEYNITFSNLSAEAKALIDMQQAQNALQKALEQRGYVSHIVVATTEKDEATETIASQSSLFERKEEQEQEQEQEQQDK